MLKTSKNKFPKKKKINLSLFFLILLLSSNAKSDFRGILSENACKENEKPYIDTKGNVRCKKCPDKSDFDKRSALIIPQGCEALKYGVLVPQEQYMSLMDELYFYREVNNEME